MLARLIVVVLGFALAACSTVDTTSMESQSKQRDARMARLYFIWPKSHMLKVGTIDIKVDGQVVGKLAPDSYFFVDRPAGTYTLKVEPPFDFTYFESDVRVAAGGTYYYGMSVKTAYIPVAAGVAVPVSHRNPGTLLQPKGSGSLATYKLNVLDAATATSEMARLGGR